MGKATHQEPSSKHLSFESRWDLVIFFLALAASVDLLVEKFYFLFTVFASQLSLPALMVVIFTNTIVYCALCAWVLILLGKNSNPAIRLYVLFFGFLLYLLTKLIQTGEITTRQGVEFSWIEHLGLMVFGHEPWKQVFLEWFVRLHLFLIFFAGLLLKQNFSIRPLIQSRAAIVFMMCLTLSFLNPNIKNMPDSLAHNSLVNVVQTSWTGKEKSYPGNKTTLGFSSRPDEKPQTHADFQARNVVVIILESTGANMLEFFGSEDAKTGSTPFLTEFARKGIAFSNTQALMTSTSKSLVSILCGIEPYPGLRSFNATLGIPVDCLPSRLSKLGYQTAYFQSAHEIYERRDLLVKKMGFEHFVALEALPEADRAAAIRANIFGLEDKALLGENRRWLEQMKISQKPFLATYLTLAQHYPYFHPDKDRNDWKGSSSDYRDAFVNSLTYVDGFLQQLIEQYKSAGLYDNTVFIILGDHGESFGLHHPPRFHNNSMYREGIWVPFIMVNEELFPEPGIDDSLQSLLNIPSTVEDLLGMEVSRHYRGVSAFSEKPQQVVYSACWYPERCLAATDKDYKYIYNFDDQAEELYQRQTDILEQNNIAHLHPELTEQYREKVSDWHTGIEAAYENYFTSLDPDYRDNPDSYYRFPMNFFTSRVKIKTD